MCYLLILLRHTILLFPFSVLCVVSLSLNDPHPLFIWHIPTHLFNFALMLLPLPTVQSLPLVVAQMVKNLPAMQETRVWSLGWEVPLEKGMATHSRIYVWVGKFPWRREWLPTPVFMSGEFHEWGAWWATVMESQRVKHDWAVTHWHSPFFTARSLCPLLTVDMNTSQ